MYRVNKKGWFNVPLGSYSNPNIVNEGNLRTVSEILQSNKITITDQDFAEIESNVKKNDFVYFDPPYHPVSNTSNFTKYTDKSFNENNLLQLVKLCKKLDERGCKIMISNSNSELVKNHFSDKKWRIHKIKVNRWINSNSQKRTGHYELLIKNY